MLYLDLSPTPAQGRADFDFKSDPLEPCPLGVKNLRDWEIPQPGWAACCLEGTSICHLVQTYA